MPAIEVQSHGVPAVADFASVLDGLLAQAETVKPAGTIEPPLHRSDFDNLSGQVSQAFAQLSSKTWEGDPKTKKIREYAIIETAARDAFSKLVVSAASQPTRKRWLTRRS